jgi:hypothetical protein
MILNYYNKFGCHEKKRKKKIQQQNKHKKKKKTTKRRKECKANAQKSKQTIYKQ